MSADSDRLIAQYLKDYDARLRRLEAVPVGPALAELTGDFLLLTGLRGLWQAGDADNAGAVYDLSGQGRTLTLNGAPQLVTAPTLFSYDQLNGTTAFFSRPSEAGLQITGTENFVTAGQRGLTIGGWFYSNAGGVGQGLIGKRTAAGNQRSYLLETGVGPTVSFLVSTDGINDVSVAGPSIPVATWFFAVGRFTPSVELKAYVNGASVANTTSIPASIFVGTAPLQIGAFNAGANLLAGQWAMSFLCAAVLPDALLTYLFARTRVFFGV